jgi:hypothetical protein
VYGIQQYHTLTLSYAYSEAALPSVEDHLHRGAGLPGRQGGALAGTGVVCLAAVLGVLLLLLYILLCVLRCVLCVLLCVLLLHLLLLCLLLLLRCVRCVLLRVSVRDEAFDGVDVVCVVPARHRHSLRGRGRGRGRGISICACAICVCVSAVCAWCGNSSAVSGERAERAVGVGAP